MPEPRSVNRLAVRIPQPSEHVEVRWHREAGQWSPPAVFIEACRHGKALGYTLTPDEAEVVANAVLSAVKIARDTSPADLDQKAKSLEATDA